MKELMSQFKMEYDMGEIQQTEPNGLFEEMLVAHEQALQDIITRERQYQEMLEESERALKASRVREEELYQSLKASQKSESEARVALKESLEREHQYEAAIEDALARECKYKEAVDAYERMLKAFKATLNAKVA
tara:strand:- start:295 stop:696 length:402 start_codon:yes stop_codon:yes gene_type:complete